ncbi:MAG: hypothetical protein LAP21_27175 [Acidobacteriia bacterium]|nr:hypothetical protein [Terriglobia bacterium]
MSEIETKSIEITNLHEAHPQLRAQDFRSPLIRRLLKVSSYRDGACVLSDSFRPPGAEEPTQRTLTLSWAGLKRDFEQVIKTYQEPVITEFATLGLACILVAKRAGLEITEVTRRGDRADYWLGDRQFLLEVSGQQTGNLEALCEEKAIQLLENPFGKPGYVCVASYDCLGARLWFYQKSGTEA